MKILVFGFLALFSWSALSIHTYVCKIKGLCNETERGQEPGFIPIVAAETDNSAVLLTPGVKESSDSLVIYFAFDRSEFKSDTATDNFSRESKLFLDKNPQSSMIIIGFTDSVGTDEYNQELGYRRAQSVQHYFESRNVPAGRMDLASKGEKQPADNNNTTSGRANNRRTLVTIKN